MIYFWTAVTMVFVVIEFATVQLVTIWFALGAIAALFACSLRAPLYLQIFIFLVSSALFLLLTRPLTTRLTQKGFSPTNADRCIGKQATVVEKIDNVNGRGTVKIEGNVWSARSDNGQPIEAEKQVVVLRIDGVKLIVKETEAEKEKEKTESAPAK